MVMSGSVQGLQKQLGEQSRGLGNLSYALKARVRATQYAGLTQSHGVIALHSLSS